jgi:hypothetical protein
MKPRIPFVSIAALTLTFAACDKPTDAGTSAQRIKELEAQVTELKKSAAAREALMHFALRVSGTMTVLGNAGMSDRTARRESFKKLDPIRDIIRENGSKAQVDEMQKLDAALEYIGQGMEAPEPGGSPRTYADAKLNEELQLPPTAENRRAVGTAMGRAVQRFTRAVGLDKLLAE